MSSSKGSSQPRDWTQVSCIAGRFFTSWATREAHRNISGAIRSCSVLIYVYKNLLHVCVTWCSVTQSCPTLCSPMDVARQAPLSMAYFRQEYWSELPFPPPGDLSDPGIEPGLLHCRQILYYLSHQGSPYRRKGSHMIGDLLEQIPW